jgi:xanthine dehydrogenase iron-sulfur cluster and FAD-binding subunit A
MWKRYLRPNSWADLRRLAVEHGASARLVAGGTDLVVELGHGVRPTETLIDLSGVAELRYIREASGWIELGALATHADVLASAACRERAWPLVEACQEVGAPQIRNRGTIVGNLVTASPANDTIAPLLALDARVVVGGGATARPDGDERVVPLRDFYPGFRQTALRPGEVVRALRFRALGPGWRARFVKLGLRRAQAISVLNLAVALRAEGERVAEARVALGCVAPTVIRSPAAEAYLSGRELTPEVCARAAELAAGDARPIDDLRGSAAYRVATLRALLADALAALAEAAPPAIDPTPVLLRDGQRPRPAAGDVAIVNGRPRSLAPTKTLLDALREDAGLTGTKEGCAEGECGACTVWLDGQAVMACLTPAGQARGVRVTTVEGLSRNGDLHPVQAAFVARGAVQCGYCTPGFVMAAASLLEEHPAPTEGQVQVALSGNICRCTGYRKILDAVLAAARKGAPESTRAADAASLARRSDA